MFLPIMWPFWSAFILASLFNKISVLIKERLKIKSRAAIIITALFFYSFSALLFWGIVASIGNAVLNASQTLPVVAEKVIFPTVEMFSQKYLDFLFFFTPNEEFSSVELAKLINSALSDTLTGVSTGLIATITSFLKNLPFFVLGFIFMIASSLYIALDYSEICSFLKNCLPPSLHTPVEKVKKFITGCVFKIFKAYGILMSLTFIELSVGLCALGIKNFVKISAIIAVLDILPLLGTGGVLVPWGIYNIFSDKAFLGTGLLLLYAVVAVVRNILEPRLIGKQLGLHPVLSLAAVFLGLKIMGIWGVFVFPIVFLGIKHILTNSKNK